MGIGSGVHWWLLVEASDWLTCIRSSAQLDRSEIDCKWASIYLVSKDWLCFGHLWALTNVKSLVWVLDLDNGAVSACWLEH